MTGQQRPDVVHTVEVVFSVHRHKTLGFLHPSFERVSFERWLLPVTICWCTRVCNHCRSKNRNVPSSPKLDATKGVAERSGGCCCNSTRCCRAEKLGSSQWGRFTCSLPNRTSAKAREFTSAKGKQRRELHEHANASAQQRSFYQTLLHEVEQQQEVERDVRRALFAVVDLATSRQFHLPPPDTKPGLYRYCIVLAI